MQSGEQADAPVAVHAPRARERGRLVVAPARRSPSRSRFIPDAWIRTKPVRYDAAP